MHVTEIELDGFEASENSTTLSGCIAFVNAEVRLSIAITLPAGSVAHPAVLHRRAVDEAIRQARRLPEYRSGRGCLSFAASLLHPTRAARCRA